MEDPILGMTLPFLGEVTWPGVSVFYDFDIKVSQTSAWINQQKCIDSWFCWVEAQSRLPTGLVPWWRNRA